MVLKTRGERFTFSFSSTLGNGLKLFCRTADIDQKHHSQMLSCRVAADVEQTSGLRSPRLITRTCQIDFSFAQSPNLSFSPGFQPGVGGAEMMVNRFNGFLGDSSSTS